MEKSWEWQPSLHYKNYENDLFRADFYKELSFAKSQKKDVNNFDVFKEIIDRVLFKHAPKKSKYIRSNQSKFMSKELRKAIMTRSRLLN